MQFHFYPKKKKITFDLVIKKRGNIQLPDRCDFDKTDVFCDKYYVCIDKYVFIVIKIKCVNSGRISDICDKVNFSTKLHTFYNT